MRIIDLAISTATAKLQNQGGAHILTGLEPLQSISSGEQVHDALLQLILKRFSDLVLLPLDRMDKTKPLLQYGMDSLIAAEFRAWFWRMLKVDVPFLTLLSPIKDLSTLASLAEAELVSRS